MSYCLTSPCNQLEKYKKRSSKDIKMSLISPIKSHFIQTTLVIKVVKYTSDIRAKPARHIFRWYFDNPFCRPLSFVILVKSTKGQIYTIDDSFARTLKFLIPENRRTNGSSYVSLTLFRIMQKPHF